jgi:hypothetical protein
MRKTLHIVNAVQYQPKPSAHIIMHLEPNFCSKGT